MTMMETKSLHWWSSPRTLLRTILMLDDTPHSIALGTAIGMFIGMTPTVGIQMVLVMLFAFLVTPLFRFNRVAALVTVYVSNPLTLVPIYWFNYEVGTLIIPGDFTRREFVRILDYEGLGELWQTLLTLFVRVGPPLMMGSLIVAGICSVLTYPIMRWLLSKFQPQKLRPPISVKPEPVATITK